MDTVRVHAGSAVYKRTCWIAVQYSIPYEVYIK